MSMTLWPRITMVRSMEYVLSFSMSRMLLQDALHIIACSVREPHANRKSNFEKDMKPESTSKSKSNRLLNTET